MPQPRSWASDPEPPPTSTPRPRRSNRTDLSISTPAPPTSSPSSSPRSTTRWPGWSTRPRPSPAAEPPVAQLWPEHFDLAVTLDEVNYGGSPGDDEHPLPYLYVGPWTLPTDGDPFWNEPFGASTTAGPALDPATALTFFTDGRRRLAG